MDDKKKLMAMRHSCEHVLHLAMTDLFPGLKRAMGPPTEDGFYFDFDYDGKVTEADFPKIEKRMKEIVKKDLPIVRQEISIEKAREMFNDNPYKLDWVDQIEKKGEKATIYWTGEPEKEGSDPDLCKGPHVESTGKVGPFKLLSIAGAYWHGDEKNKMLTRIYGTCFPTREELDKYLWQLEEAKKRDHRKLGEQLDLWTISDKVGTGLPLFTPKGALVRRLINEFVEELQSSQGISQVWTPQIAKAELFKISGHYDKYRENMFEVHSHFSDEEFFLKPMNCPQHTQIYASCLRSYKDLPLRYADFAMLYRDEKPGELLGLARTRSFSQDDCHVFCREDQIVEEANKAMDMTKKIMDTYGFKYRYRVSLSDPKHPEKYLGDKNIWNKAEKLSEEIIKKRGMEYYLGIGEAAFYGPKLDLIATDSIGRQWQLSTLQIDFFMPQRFNLTYIDENGREQQPVMLHRAISGSPERLMAILLEHFSGSLPLWLSPVQVCVLPISEKQAEYAKKATDLLKDAGIRVELNLDNKTIGAKIRQSTLQKVPYMIIIGDKEVQSSKFKVQNEEDLKISIRTREGNDLGMMGLNKFINVLKEQIETKAISAK